MQGGPSGNGRARAMTKPKGIPRGRVLPPGPWEESSASSIQSCTQAGTLLLEVLDVTGTLLFPTF